MRIGADIYGYWVSLLVDGHLADNWLTLRGQVRTTGDLADTNFVFGPDSILLLLLWMCK